MDVPSVDAEEGLDTASGPLHVWDHLGVSAI